MKYRNAIAAVVLAAGIALPVTAAEPAFTEQGAATCLSCHDFGPGSPVHPMLDSKHGQAANPDAPMGQHGCESCHGPSEAHTKAPTRVAPEISFGPRWSATIRQQNGSCLECHRDDVARHWEGGTHQKADVTCVTCHDAHVRQDKVLQDAAQREVCATCHKVQKDGIHTLHDKLADNPPCTQCHEPHGNASPVAVMLENRSEGCRECHDLVAMASDPTVSERATSYHKTMAQPGRSCIDCHQGIAHAAADSVPVRLAQAVSSKRITLFYPGQSDMEWLLSEHPGAQSFRQGRNCTQCHMGEEAEMGASLAPAGATPVRAVDVAFARESDGMVIRLSWAGASDDVDIAMMWGGDREPDFSRGGCWAACHSDMPGMTRDRGQQQGKYLRASRAQLQRIGLPPQVKTEAELAAMVEQGIYVELLRVKLNGGKGARLETARLLESLDWSYSTPVTATARFADGRWEVELRRPMVTGMHTFGLALHGAGKPGPGHWVSLPMTFAPGGEDTDFILP